MSIVGETDSPIEPPNPRAQPTAGRVTGVRDRVAIISGGAGEIGRAFAAGLCAAGARVALVDIDGARVGKMANEMAKSHPGAVLGIAGDVLDADSLRRADERVTAEWGDPSFLINCAGGNTPAATTKDERVAADLSNLDDSFFGIDVGSFRHSLDLNLLGTVLPSRVFGRRLVEQGGGAIVNIASMNAYRPLTRIPAYSAAKSAVVNFTEWLAVHLAPSGVRVNAIAPGFFLTPQLEYLAYEENGDLTPRYQRVLAQTPMGRFGQTDELVGTLLYLISSQSAFVTGVTIPVDGGFNAYSGV